MIVPGGGLSADGAKWVACRKNFFLSVRVLSRLYRRFILEGLVRLHKAEKLQFFGDLADLARTAAFNDVLKPLRKIDWVVPSHCLPANNCQAAYAKEPFAGPNTARQCMFTCMRGGRTGDIYRDIRTALRSPTAA
jgi:hypothetical protein